MEPQTFGAYAPKTSLPSGSTPAAPYSQGFTQHAWLMGAPAHGGLFGMPDWDGGCVSLSELEGGGAGADIIGPSQTYDASPLQAQDDPFTVLQMHSRIQRGTYVDDLGLGGGTREHEDRDRRSRYS
jgi:hypothetical protein